MSGAPSSCNRHFGRPPKRLPAPAANKTAPSVKFGGIGATTRKSQVDVRDRHPSFKSRQKSQHLAETEGFEPSMRLYTPYSLSRGAPSATRSRFQNYDYKRATQSVLEFTSIASWQKPIPIAPPGSDNRKDHCKYRLTSVKNAAVIALFQAIYTAPWANKISPRLTCTQVMSELKHAVFSAK